LVVIGGEGEDALWNAGSVVSQLFGIVARYYEQVFAFGVWGW